MPWKAWVSRRSPCRGEVGDAARYFDQVEAASNAHLYYLALAGALILPDVCGSMEAADGRANGKRYIAWFDRHLAGYAPFMTGEDCYGLRCSMLHQARFEPHKGSYSRVLFVEPGAIGGTLHNLVLQDALNIDVQRFVGDMVAAARAWFEAARDNPVVQANFGKMMQRYPNGLSPYIGNAPVIS